LFRYRVHLEVVCVPPVAWNLDTAKTILGSSGLVERLGSETASHADMGSFWRGPTMWRCSRNQNSFVFGDDDDDLLPDYSLFECNNKYLVMYDLIYIRLHILHTSIYLEK
jgi:hypothetical protein